MVENEESNLNKALRAILVRTNDEAQRWEKLARLGATDKQVRATISNCLPVNGRMESRPSLCAFKLKPKLAFWFGNRGVGKPTLEGEELIEKVREVFSVGAEGEAAPSETDADAELASALDLLHNDPNRLYERLESRESVATVEQEVAQEPNTSLQLSLFDYSTLDEDTAVFARAAAIEVQERIGRMQKSSFEIGRKLREVKTRMPGQFGAWLEAETALSRDTADRLIAVAEEAERSPQFAESIGRFSKTAQYLMVKPTTPEEAKAELLERAQAGPVTSSAAKEIVERHKPQKEPKAGTCRVCGCTNTSPCEGGCSWSDDTETLCTSCDGVESKPLGPEASWPGSPIIVTRTVDDLLDLLKGTPGGMQAADLKEMGFTPGTIDQAAKERRIDWNAADKYFYAWRPQDVADLVLTLGGNVSLGTLERHGCQRTAINAAQADGLMLRNSNGNYSTVAGTAYKTKDRPHDGPAPKVEPKIEDLLKGRALSVSFSWIPGVPKVTVGVCVGTDRTKTKFETMESGKVRFPEAVSELIAAQLKTGKPASGSGQKAASIRKGSTKKKPAAKPPVKTARQKAATAKRQAKRSPASRAASKRAVKGKKR